MEVLSDMGTMGCEGTRINGNRWSHFIITRILSLQLFSAILLKDVNRVGKASCVNRRVRPRNRALRTLAGR